MQPFFDFFPPKNPQLAFRTSQSFIDGGAAQPSPAPRAMPCLHPVDLFVCVTNDGTGEETLQPVCGARHESAWGATVEGLDWNSFSRTPRVSLGEVPPSCGMLGARARMTSDDRKVSLALSKAVGLGTRVVCVDTVGRGFWWRRLGLLGIPHPPPRLRHQAACTQLAERMQNACLRYQVH